MVRRKKSSRPNCVRSGSVPSQKSCATGYSLIGFKDKCKLLCLLVDKFCPSWDAKCEVVDKFTQEENGDICPKSGEIEEGCFCKPTNSFSCTEKSFCDIGKGFFSEPSEFWRSGLCTSCLCLYFYSNWLCDIGLPLSLPIRSLDWAKGNFWSLF